MLIAINEYNQRIIPEKGKTGFCQICKNPVKAYCGEINIDHWRHVAEQNCDTWKEHESEWHREWKNKFPEDWQEVIIEINNEKHIADIKTNNGLILELQNSSISKATIKERELFYQNIVWLINANTFKDNFSIRSIVKQELRYIDSQLKHLNHKSDYKDSDSKNKEKEITRKEDSITKLSLKIESTKKKIVDITSAQNNITELLNNYLSTQYFYDRILNDFETVNKDKVQKIQTAIDELQQNSQIETQKIEFINSLVQCNLTGYEDFKFINPDHIKSSSYQNCRLIYKETENSLFPTILSFKSEQEFIQTSKNNNYRLIVNPKKVISETSKKIEELKLSVQKETNNLRYIFDETKVQLQNYLETQKNKQEEILEDLELDKVGFESEIFYQKRDLENYLIEQSLNKEIELKELETVLNKKRILKMNKFKGLYNYEWKHRRKSWDDALGRLYLDFENHIFEIIDDNTLKKINTEDFIDKIKKWR